MAMTQVLRYLENKDASSIHYKTFNETPLDTYPTFSICFVSKGGHTLQHFWKEEIEAQTGISEFLFDQLIKGNERGIYSKNASKILRLKLNPFRLKLDALLHAIGLEKQNENEAEHEEELPYYESYIDPDTICISLKSTDKIGIFRRRDWVSFNWATLEEAKVLVQAYVHYPNRLTREIGKPNFELDVDYLEEYTSKTTLQLNRMILMRKRPDAEEPCDKNLENDDHQFRTHVMKKVGCIPMYWENFVSLNHSLTPCKSLEEMKMIYEAIQNKKNIFSEYDQPCNYMEVSLGTSQQTSSYEGVIVLELEYMKQLYLEIENIQDFGFESFWSSVGGFVGIFLGYSLLALPDVVELILLWLQGKTIEVKKERKRNQTCSKGNKK